MLEICPVSSVMPSTAHPENQGTWVNAINPSAEECEQLAKDYQVPLDFLMAALDHNEHPHFEQDSNCCFLLIRASNSEDSNPALPFSTHPIGIILTHDTLITVCTLSQSVKAFLQKKLRYAPERPLQGMILSILFHTGTRFIRHLREMLEATQVIESTLQQSMQNKELLNLLHMEKSLIYFLTALKANLSILEKLNLANPLQLSRKEKNILEASRIEMRQAADMAEIFSQILGSVGDAFGAIISNNLNKVMKVLTAITIVLMIPTLIAGIYGMNVSLPLQTHPFIFFWLSLSTLGLSALTGYFFWKKNWM